MAAKYAFTATHGVHLADLGVQFVRDGFKRTEAGVDELVYRFETDDKAVADKVAKVEGYGITKADPSADAADES